RTIAVPRENNLAFQARLAVRTNIEPTLGRRAARRKSHVDGVFAACLSWWDVPGERGNTVRNRRGAGGYGVAFRPFCFVRRSVWTFAGGHGGMTFRAKHNAAHVDSLAGMIQGLVGADVCQITLRAEIEERSRGLHAQNKLCDNKK